MKHPALCLERLGSRITPSVSREVGTLQIVDISANPNYEWASPRTGQSITGGAIGTDQIAATLDVSYTLTGDELAEALKGGFTLTDERVGWLEADTNFWGKRTWDTIKQVGFEVTFRPPAGTTGSYRETIVIPFGINTTNDAWKDDPTNDAEYYGWLADGEGRPTATSRLITACIQLVSVPAPGPNTSGTAGKTLRPRTGEISKTDLAAIPPPDLPPLAAGGYYRLLTFHSPDGVNFDFTAANNTGYGVFTASTLNLVENPNDPDGPLILDPAATLSAVYPDSTSTAGAYNGANNSLVVRPNDGGAAGLLSAYAYSGLPSALLTVADGQSVTIAPGDIPDGSDMLWLFYDSGGQTQCFVLVPTTSSDPQLTVSDVSVTEGNSGTTNATFTVSLSAAWTSTITVNYGTVGGTATAGTDFAAASGTLTFAPGETTKTVSVAVAGDTTFEPNEDFFLTFSSATNAVIADSVGMATILNDDAQPTIAINDVSQVVGTSGTTQFVFTVTLSNPSWQTITVDFATADGTATAGTDYQATSGTLTFLPGETSKTITITVYGSPTAAGKSFYVNLSNPIDAAFLDNQGRGLAIMQE